METRCSAGARSGRVLAVCAETLWPGGGSRHTRGHGPRQRTGENHPSVPAALLAVCYPRGQRSSPSEDLRNCWVSTDSGQLNRGGDGKFLDWEQLYDRVDCLNY